MRESNARPISARPIRGKPVWRIAVATLAGLFAFNAAGRAAPRGTARPTPPEGGAGRDASRPQEIPAAGWWRILKRTMFQASEDRLLTEAAGVTFYTLLALFPGIAALVSIYGIFADRATIGDHLSLLSGIVPGGGMALITEQVNRLAEQPPARLGFGALAGIAIALWSANQATKAIFDALNVVYEETEKRGFVRLTMTTLMFTLAGILFAILAVGMVVFVPVLLNLLGLGDALGWVLGLARWPLMLAAIGLVLACLYRWGPSRADPKWRWVSWGSAVAAVLWLAASLGFSWYVENFGSYNETYGSLGAVIGFMTWIWISAAVVLLGAELNAEMEHQTARDTTTGPEQPMGRRAARMADTTAVG